jgi:glucosylglycerate synthase
MAEVDVQQNAPQEPAVLGTAEIVLGILSYNNAETIAPVVRTVQAGLSRYFPDNRSVLVHADGGSKDGTRELALAAALDKNSVVQVTYPVYPVHKLSPEYYGIPGRGNAVRAVFEAAGKLQAKACAVLDSNVRGLKPEWTEALVRPALEDRFDFISPYYLRHKYDGLILNGIVYPLIRSLYGKRIRQPIGGDFAFSARLISHYMQAQWDREIAGAGVDAWTTTQAIAGGFRLAQVLSEPRIQSQYEPAPEVSTVLAQVLGSVFTEVNRTAPVWQRIRGSEPVPTFGVDSPPAAEPPPIDIHSMVESFRLGYQNLQDVWSIVLPPATLLQLKRMASYPDDTFRFEDAVWAKAIYDFALAYHIRVMDRDHLLRALTPLYLGWAASYVLQVSDSTADQANARIETLCRAYEAQKGYLISRWRWPDRFNP